MSTSARVVPVEPRTRGLAYRLRVVSVFARTEFKLKYAGSIFGYLWSLAKPLLYFAILWVVFGHVFKTGIPHFAVYLLVGVVLYTFMADAVALSVPSIVVRGSVVRRISFPSIVIPVATTVTAALTLLLNSVAVAVFFAFAGIRPHVDWLLLVPLVLELWLFTIGLSLIFSSLYVRFRDAGQIWEVLSTIFLFGTPIMYPMHVLPGWAQKLASTSPLLQVVQDARRLILNSDPQARALVATSLPRFVPVLDALLVLAVGVWLYRRQAPTFPEIA